MSEKSLADGQGKLSAAGGIAGGCLTVTGRGVRVALEELLWFSIIRKLAPTTRTISTTSTKKCATSFLIPGAYIMLGNLPTTLPSLRSRRRVLRGRIGSLSTRARIWVIIAS